MRDELNRRHRSHPWSPGWLRVRTAALLLPLFLGGPAVGYAGRDDGVVVKWLLELGQEARQKGKAGEALDYFQKVLLLQPSHPEALRLVQELTHADAPLPPPAQPAPPPGAELEGLPVPGEPPPAVSPPPQEEPPSVPPADLALPSQRPSPPEAVPAPPEPDVDPAQAVEPEADTVSPVPRVPASLEPDPAAREQAIDMAVARLMQAPVSSDAPMERRDEVASSAFAGSPGRQSGEAGEADAASRSGSAVPVMMPESGFQPIRVVINGRPAASSFPVTVRDGEMLVPCRLVAESLGYTVTSLDPDHVEVVSARGNTWRLELPGYNRSLLMPAGELERCLPVTVRFDAPNRTLQISERKTPPKAFRTRYPTPVNAPWD